MPACFVVLQLRSDSCEIHGYVMLSVRMCAHVRREARLRSVFRQFDKDGSGFIDRSELDAVFNELGKDFDDDDLQRMIGLADQDASGTLNYEEFISYVFG